MMKALKKRSREPLRCRSVDRRGSILVVSLWVLSVLGAFSISAGYYVRQKITLADRLDVRNLLYGLAESGVQQAVIELKREDVTPGYEILNESWSSKPELFSAVPVEEGTFTVSYAVRGTQKRRFGARDEESKINLNTAKPEVMRKLFQLVAGLDEDVASEIAYGIVDWRDADTFHSHPEYGAEDDYYESLKLPYESKDLPMEVLDEVLLVRGMTPEIFEKIRDDVTIYGSGSVNVNTAPREILLALGLSEKAADRILAFRAGPDKEEATADDFIFTQAEAITSELSKSESLPSAEAAEISNLVSAGLLKTASSVFMVQSRGELRGKRAAIDITAVVERTGKILFWSVGTPRQLEQKEIDEAPPVAEKK